MSGGAVPTGGMAGVGVSAGGGYGHHFLRHSGFPECRREVRGGDAYALRREHIVQAARRAAAAATTHRDQHHYDRFVTVRILH